MAKFEPTLRDFQGLPGQRRRRHFDGTALIRVAPAQSYPYESPNSARDPRAFGQGYSSAVKGDMEAIGRERAALSRGVAELEDVINQTDARGVPPGIKQGSFIQFIQAAGPAGAVRLIPYNKRRMGLVISNYRGSNLVMFSFGQPIQTAANEGAGIPLTPCYQETNGTVSQDEVWVFCNDVSESFPIPVLGYDGGLSIVGNRR